MRRAIELGELGLLRLGELGLLRLGEPKIWVRPAGDQARGELSTFLLLPLFRRLRGLVGLGLRACLPTP